MKGETGYLLPYGCAHAPEAYKWKLGGFAFMFLSSTSIEIFFLFLPVPVVLLLNILSRVYCHNYKLNFIIIKENKQGF